MSKPRAGALAAIHLGKKQLGWSEDVYRDVVAGVCAGRTRSAGELTSAERARLLDIMREQGFKPTRPVRKHDAVPTQADKARELWGDLVALGCLRAGTDAALQAFVERQTGKSRMEWCTPQELNAVIEALKSWLTRERRRRREVAR